MAANDALIVLVKCGVQGLGKNRGIGNGSFQLGHNAISVLAVEHVRSLVFERCGQPFVPLADIAVLALQQVKTGAQFTELLHRGDFDAAKRAIGVFAKDFFFVTAVGVIEDFYRHGLIRLSR